MRTVAKSPARAAAGRPETRVTPSTSGACQGARAIHRLRPEGAGPWSSTRAAVPMRARLAAALRGMGWTVCGSEANFLWAVPFGRTAREVFDALRRRAIVVRHWPGPRIGDYIRITVGTDAQIDTLLAALREET